MQIEKLMQEADSREKILDAKIEDQGDKLRLGMVSLQSAIGEGMSQSFAPSGAEEVTKYCNTGKPLNGDIDDGDFVALDEVEKIQSEAMDGLRESFAKQLSTIEADISSLNSKFKNNSDVRQPFNAVFFSLNTYFLSVAYRGQIEESPEGWRGCQQHPGRQAPPEDGLDGVHPGAAAAPRGGARGSDWWGIICGCL